MATLRKIIYDMWDIVTPTISDDSDFSERQFAWWIKTQRALMIRNEYNKNRTFDPATVQDLGCLELEVADRADCCEITADCKILRTVQEIPKPIELHNSQAITRVGNVDKMDVNYNFVPYETAIYSGNGRYSKNNIYAFWLNNRIYIKASNCSLGNFLEHINVRGIFQDPEEAGKLNTCDGACYTKDDDFPINLWMIDYMKANIINGNLKVALQSIGDGENNAKSDNANEASEVKQVNG